MTIRWRVGPEDGSTVGEVVARAGGDRDAIAEGRVFIGRRRARSAHDPVRVGDEITIAPKVDEAGEPVAILAHVDGLVAVSKPAGIPTIADHAGAHHALQEITARLLRVSPARLHPTSRLDRDVSGVVIFASSKGAAEHLERARERGEYVRRYVALAARAPEPREGGWDAPIGRAADPRHRAVHGRDAIPARTDYACVAQAGDVTLLAVAPQTGRTHQIRVHASHAGAPLLGDRTYGGPGRLTLESGAVIPLTRIALHAVRVVVPSPRGETLDLRAPVPAPLPEWWQRLGGDPAAWDTASTCPVLGQSPE